MGLLKQTWVRDIRKASLKERLTEQFISMENNIDGEEKQNQYRDRFLTIC